jgi:hypothetical protein
MRSEVLSDEAQIGVAASEYMLRHKFAHLTNGTIFVTLSSTEMQALAANLPGFRFRSIDKMISGNIDDNNLTRDSETGDTGFGLIVNGKLTGTNEATVRVAAIFTGSATLFECHLSKKPSKWIVLSISDAGVADGPYRPPARQ